MKAQFIFPLAASLLLASCGQPAPEASSSKPVESSNSESSVVSSEPSLTSASQEQSTSEPIVQYKVTFHWNYEGATDVEVLVDEGEAVAQPETIERQGYAFTGWYTEAAAENAYDFSSAITANLDLYAGWMVKDENTISCTFYWNYEGASDPIYQTVYFTKGGRMTAPADPVREGYSFRGWFTEAACENAFAVKARYSEDVVAYAKWFNSYTFEAEYTQFTDLPEDDMTANEYGDKIGHGYSSDVSGLGLIFKDDDKSNCKASNGYYVTDLYYNGAFLEFDIMSDKAVDDAVLTARLTAEYFDMTFVPSKRNSWPDGAETPNSGYDFVVNDVALDYDDIKITNVPTGRSDAKKRDFSNYLVTGALSLKEGKNVIKMVTKNNHRHDSTGTMAAMAPMVDCLYVLSDAALTFDAHTGNIKK